MITENPNAPTPLFGTVVELYERPGWNDRGRWYEIVVELDDGSRIAGPAPSLLVGLDPALAVGDRIGFDPIPAPARPIYGELDPEPLGGPVDAFFYGGSFARRLSTGGDR